VDSLVGGVYAFADLPTAVGNTGMIIYVSNENGGGVVAFSDSVDWRQIGDRSLIIGPWIQPVMTSATVPANYIITTNSQQSNRYWQAFDGIEDNANSWLTQFSIFDPGTGLYTGPSTGKTGIPNQGVWLVMEMDAPHVVNQYSIAQRPGFAGSSVSWHLMYSLNGTDYVSIDNQIDQVLGSGTTYNFTNTSIMAQWWGIQIYEIGTESYVLLNELTFANV
jgi:hypothetical protein